jgi:hypothetical protein
MKQESKTLGPEAADKSAHLDITGYDGCGIIEAPTMEAFAAAFEDPYYINVISPDEDTFVDKNLGALRAKGEAWNSI